MPAMSSGDDLIPLSAPWIEDREMERVRAALAGRLAGDGPFGRKVEKRLAALLDARVLLTTSCTHALELALLVLGIGAGDEVICPSFTFVSTANAVLRAGGTPVFAEIEEHALGLDVQDVERRLTPRTRAILLVHYAGIAGAHLDALLDLAARRRLLVIEDAAQAFGSTHRGRALGTLGDAGCFSFHETKNVTCGEGGALVLRDEPRAARAEIVREKGTNRHAFLRGEVDKYTWVLEGSSYVLSDVLAAILDAQLDKMTEIQARRARVAGRYREGLTEWAERHAVRLSAPPAEGTGTGNDHIFYLLFARPEQRDAAMAHLKSRGVGAVFHYVPLHSSPRGRLLAPQLELPITDRVAETLLRLPLHPQLTEADVDRVIEAVRTCLG
jgi:dTDP-4-amino-4,6-dideoxygalactose transaminase